MFLMIANNDSSYSGHNEVNRVEENEDESKKMWKSVNARVVVLILNSIIL